MTAASFTDPVGILEATAADKQLVPILVVDDNPAKRVALKSVLLPLGYSIVEADSGPAALRCILAQDFAVILLDVRMPLMDGFETAALIRQRRESEMTPIIFFTAYGNEDITDADRYAEGAVDFMFAPVRPEEIRAKVSVFANLFTKARVLATHTQVVEASADHLRLLTDAAPIGIFQTDAENQYVYTNPRWTEITGIGAEQAAGRTWDAISGSELVSGLGGARPDDTVSRDESSQRFEIPVPGSNPQVVLITSKPIPKRNGGTAGWVGTLADVTAEAGAEAAMSHARDAANEASQLKSDFLANMSHEIRTPMNGVIGMTDLLLETDLDVRQRDYAQTVRNSGEALLSIIDDILDFSKVEAGMVEVEKVEFNVQDTVHDVVDLLARSAQAKGLELVAVLERTVPSVVTGDPGRVRQVLTNLIGNAVKFTQSGEIVVRVSADGSAGADTVVRFQVTDTGDGIEAGKLSLIFQPFVQGDTSTSRKYGGTGLGLAVTEELVALLGGTCGVSSRIGAGSTFWFTVPFTTAAGESTPDLQSSDAELAGITALIVDDNQTQREVLRDYLTDWGMVVTAVASGEAALATMHAAAPDRPFVVALVDQSMPDMDGLGLSSAIALDPDLMASVVLVTCLGHEEVSGDPAVTGVAASLSKPIHRETLRACLRVALGLPTSDLAAPRKAAERPTERHLSATGRILLAEDNPINQKVAVAMLSGAGYRVDTVHNGAAAVEAAAAQRYDVILMDCQMPELSGYEATAAIRAREGLEWHTPIIALTAGARKEDRERCLAQGMDSYLSKPLRKDVFLDLVAKTVKSGPIATGPLEAAHSAVAEVMIDPAVVEELAALAAGGEPDFLPNLIGQFARETESRLVELREAVETGDGAAAGRIAHIIQGSGSQLGGRRLAL
ncbi:MAG: two-component system, sensor histidine kinase and response regulator, partial [Frankiaceae bacterium]|nr:two-component system, sensor histidine kinase and response regulator [Frankiaceae bacterium]